MDPMSEKYYGISPYAYCGSDPVNYVDPDGKDNWEINQDGYITWVNESKEHRLYAFDSQGNRTVLNSN